MATNTTKTVKTQKPTGGTLTRNGNKWTYKWKIGDKDYGDGQQLQYRIYKNKKSKWVNVEIGKTATSKTVTLSLPNGVKNVSFRVRGNRKTYTESKGSGKNKKTTTYKPTVSAWETKTKNISIPDKPTASVSRNETLENVSTFSWNTTNSDAANMRIFTECQWQSLLVLNSTVTDGSKLKWDSNQLGWATGTGGASGSKAFTESTARLAAATCTRWFRIKAVGPAGETGWTYVKMVYARPYQAKITSVKASKVAAGGYLCTVSWVADQDAAHPISKTIVQYGIGTPGPGLSCPDGLSWKDASTTRDTGANKQADAASFSIDDQVGTDQCLFVRVNTVYDINPNPTYGVPVLADTGVLADPSNLSVETSDVTYRATITATNGSSVPDSFLVVVYCTDRNPQGDIVGVIPHGQTSITVQCANWSQMRAKAFKVYAAVGSYRDATGSDGVSIYAVTVKMRSRNTLTYGGSIPLPPEDVVLAQTNNAGTIQVTWTWAWVEADGAELSWSEHEDAWESTDEPESYTISNLNAARWNISGLETGITWYVRVRLIKGTGESATKGPWCEVKSIDLSSAPMVPALTLSAAVITPTDMVKASWAYVTTDGTGQASADLAEVVETGGIISYVPLVSVKSAQSVDLSAQQLGWKAGETHTLAVKVVSASGRASDDWSEPVTVTIAEPIVAAITGTSLVETETVVTPAEYTATVDATEAITSVTATAQTLAEAFSITEGSFVITIASESAEDGWTITDGTTAATVTLADLGSTYGITVTGATYPSAEGDPLPNAIISLDVVPAETEKVTALTNMPLTVTVTGAGPGGTTTLVIERAAAYHVDRPDETDFNGYEGETIAILQMAGEGQFVINRTDLIGPLDDEAAYRLIATVQDTYGQSSAAVLEFEVAWYHQAIIPEAEVVIDETNLIALLTPIAPSGMLAGDTCDIYRLSVDKPVLIVEGAEFGTQYVDPYPTIGDYGGHRFVYRTIDGDYITQDKHLAWLDLKAADDDVINSPANIIEFDTGRVELEYNVDLSNSWSKDFTETQYLGGSIQGDWNPAVSRNGGVKSVAVAAEDPELIEAMRRLADWPGICHVRTKDGSSYAADVQVSEDYAVDTAHKIASFDLRITRVDSEILDGMTKAEWDELHEEE